MYHQLCLHKNSLLVFLLSLLLCRTGCWANAETNPQFMYLQEPDDALVLDGSEGIEEYDLENEGKSSYYENDSWDPKTSHELLKKAPTQFLKRSTSYFEDAEGYPEFSIRSPTTFMKRSPTSYLKRSPTAYLKRSPTSFMKRAPTAFIKRAPTTFMKRAPTTFMKRSPTSFMKKSPTSFMKRAPAMFE